MLLTSILVYSFSGCSMFIRTAPSLELEIDQIPEFSSKDLNNNPVTNEVFKNADVNIIVVWETAYPISINNLPEIEQLSKDCENLEVGLFGIVRDTPDQEVFANHVVKTKKLTFANIVPDEKLADGFVQYINVLPTVLFVDSEGNILGEPITGSLSAATYLEKLNEILDSVRA